MKSQARNGLNEECGDWPCSVCCSCVRRNSIESVLCKKLVHNRRSVVKGKMKTNHKFQCFVCTGRVANMAMEDKAVALDNAGQFDCVDRFC
jgi:hypothetical protein